MSNDAVRANRRDLERRVRDGEITPALAAQDILDMVHRPADETPG
jgi:LAO/AO transport system kinase